MRRTSSGAARRSVQSRMTKSTSGPAVKRLDSSARANRTGCSTKATADFKAMRTQFVVENNEIMPFNAKFETQWTAHDVRRTNKDKSREAAT